MGIPDATHAFWSNIKATRSWPKMLVPKRMSLRTERMYFGSWWGHVNLTSPWIRTTELHDLEWKRYLSNIKDLVFRCCIHHRAAASHNDIKCKGVLLPPLARCSRGLWSTATSSRPAISCSQASSLIMSSLDVIGFFLPNVTSFLQDSPWNLHFLE